MTQELYAVVSRDCFPTVNVESFDFGLGCQGHDCLDEVGNSEDRTVVMGVRCVAGHEEMSSCLTASIGFQELGCISAARTMSHAW